MSLKKHIPELKDNSQLKKSTNSLQFLSMQGNVEAAKVDEYEEHYHKLYAKYYDHIHYIYQEIDDILYMGQQQPETKVENIHSKKKFETPNYKPLLPQLFKSDEFLSAQSIFEDNIFNNNEGESSGNEQQIIDIHNEETELSDDLLMEANQVDENGNNMIFKRLKILKKQIKVFKKQHEQEQSIIQQNDQRDLSRLVKSISGNTLICVRSEDNILRYLKSNVMNMRQILSHEQKSGTAYIEIQDKYWQEEKMDVEIEQEVSEVIELESYSVENSYYEEKQEKQNQGRQGFEVKQFQLDEQDEILVQTASFCQSSMKNNSQKNNKILKGFQPPILHIKTKISDSEEKSVIDISNIAKLESSDDWSLESLELISPCGKASSRKPPLPTLVHIPRLNLSGIQGQFIAKQSNIEQKYIIPHPPVKNTHSSPSHVARKQKQNISLNLEEQEKEECIDMFRSNRFKDKTAQN